MAKRNAAEASFTGYEDHRSKRRRDITDAGSSYDYDSASEDSSGDEYGNEPRQSTGGGGEGVKQFGTSLLNVLKTAKSKDGRLLSTHFMRQPPKRDYPDYYLTISHPIALNDIQRKLLNGRYPSVEAVKADFDLCFNNAKTYNMPESDIYVDADTMQHLVAREYEKSIAGTRDDMQVDVEDPGDDSGPDQHKKTKGLNLHRLLKTRLGQLLSKSDDNGRIISGLFIELPSKKDWPTYYKTIKRPMAFDAIKSKLKRKEYNSSLSFANDVELVFSNAMQFNAEHSEIWEDALSLRDTFRQLMSDLPEPYNIPVYSKPPTKLKLKLPAIKPPQPPAPPVAAPVPVAEVPVVQPVRVEKPEPVPEVPPPVSAPPPPRAPSPKLPSSSSIKLHKSANSAASVSVKAQAPATPAPVTRTRSEAASVAATSTPTPVVSHPPQERSLRSLAAITAALPPAAPLPKATPIKLAPPPPPPPAPHYHYLIKQAILQTEPQGRMILLDQSNGVKHWVIHLGNDEKSLVLRDVEFVANEEDVSSGDEDEHDEEEEEEEQDPSAVNGKKVKRGRGRPAKNAAKPKLPKSNSPSKKKPKLGEVQVKLDGKLVPDMDSSRGLWSLPVTTSTHIVEVGEKDGMVWRVYAYQQT